MICYIRRTRRCMQHAAPCAVRGHCPRTRARHTAGRSARPHGKNHSTTGIGSGVGVPTNTAVTLDQGSTKLAHGCRWPHGAMPAPSVPRGNERVSEHRGRHSLGMMLRGCGLRQHSGAGSAALTAARARAPLRLPQHQLRESQTPFLCAEGGGVAGTAQNEGC